MIRTRFIVLLILVCAFVPFLSRAIAQSVPQTIPIGINTATSTQLLAAAGRTNIANVIAFALGETMTSGVTTEGSIQFVTGTVDGETIPCTTGRANLTGALTIGSGNTGGLFPVIWGNPVMVIPASATLCAVTTNSATFGGWMHVVR